MIVISIIALSVHALYWVALRRGFLGASSAWGTARRGAAASGAEQPGSTARGSAQRGTTVQGSAIQDTAETPMSVVVAARDEAAALPTLLRALGRQAHPDFEIVIVDDGSSDRTPEILSNAAASNLLVITTKGIGKKAALARGIDAASNELLAFTDADCSPPPHWLSILAQEHAACEGDCVLIGYSPFVDSNDSGSAQRRTARAGDITGPATGSDNPAASRVVARLAQYETFVTGFLTAAAAGLGRPYMAVGRNISYPRAVFERVGGFEAIMHSLSGDDDLFVQEVAHRKAAQVRAVLNPQTFVPTLPPATLRAWIRQKRRHASAGRFYVRSIQAHLAVFHGTNLIVWLAPFLVGWPGAALLALKLALQFVVLREAAGRLGEADLILIQPLLEPLYLLYNVILAPIGLVKMPRRW